MGNVALLQSTRSGPLMVDRELIQRCQQGDQAAFETLVKKHERRVFGLIYQMVRQPSEVEDIAQEVFTKIYFSLPQFRVGASFEAWMYRITINHCCDHLRKRKREPQVRESELREDEAAEFEQFGSATQFTHWDISKRLEIRQTAEKLLSLLPPKDRTLLMLKEMEDLSIDELTQIFNSSASAIKLRLFRARNLLKAAYEKTRGKAKGSLKI
jgi:RNA polymerase sigma-70 factor (ECF subfamily)